jgi:fructokinase
MLSLRIGVDLGGTKIEAIALRADGTEHHRVRTSTPSNSYIETIQEIARLVSTVAADADEATVGVGTPGSVNPATGLHRNANSECLNGQPFERDLAAALSWPLRTANDANCFALSEAVDGAGQGAHVVFGVILGTGCGGGVVIDGVALAGANGIAGEWGHMALPRRDGAAWERRSCYCGRTDCIEQYLAGPAIEAEHERETGVQLDCEAMVNGTDPETARVLERFYDRLAESLVTVVDTLDPDVIVLGGGVSNIAQIYDIVPPLIHERAFSDACTTPILKNVHGDSSGVRGAAWLWS